MRELYDLVMRELIPHIVEFFAGLLNPSKPGPTLERISVLGCIILSVMLAYVLNTAFNKQEYYAQLAGKSDGYVATINNLKDQISDYKLQLKQANSKLAEKELKLEQCLMDPLSYSGPGTRGRQALTDEVNEMR